jgi:hypothetical protein
MMGGVGWAADLDKVKAEPNLEKRSRLALENADHALKKARAAYNEGDLKAATALVAEVQDSVLLAEASLKETGKNPRKSPKWFKRAEIQTRDLLRKLDAFGQEMSVDDRSILGPVKAKVQEVHEGLLIGIMEGKK